MMVSVNSECPIAGRHVWNFQSIGSAYATCIHCSAELDPDQAKLTPEQVEEQRKIQKQTPLDWYAEHAEALKRYTEANPPQVDGIAAVVAALAIDGGRRGGRKP